MYTDNFTKAYDHVMRDNSQSLLARLIYCRLARFTENGKDAFPRVQWLAEEFGSNESQIKRELKKLAEAGLINKKQRGLKMSNAYTVNEWPLEANNSVVQARKERGETGGSNVTFLEVSDPTCLERSDVTCQEVSDPTYIGDKLKETSYSIQLINKQEEDRSDVTVIEPSPSKEETMNNYDPFSAYSFLSASKEACDLSASEPSACEASSTPQLERLDDLGYCVSLAVAKCKEHDVKADPESIERNLVRNGYFKICRGYDVLDTVYFEAPF